MTIAKESLMRASTFRLDDCW